MNDYENLQNEEVLLPKANEQEIPSETEEEPSLEDQLLDQLEQTQDELEQTQEELDKTQAELAQTKETLGQIQTELKDSNLKNEELEQTISKLQARISENSSVIFLLRNELEKKSMRIKELGESARVLKENEELKALIYKVQIENARLKEEVEAVKKHWDEVKDELERGLNSLSYREGNLKYKEENFEKLLDERTKQMRFETEENWKFYWKRREFERAKEHQIEMKDITRFQMILALYIAIITCIDAWKLDLYKNGIIEFFETKVRLFSGVMSEAQYWSGYLVNMISKGNTNEVITSIVTTVAGLIVAALAIVAVGGIIYFIYRNIIRNMDYRIGLVTIVTLSLPVYVTSVITDIFHPGYAEVNPFLISLYLFAIGASLVLYIERSMKGNVFDYEKPGIRKRGYAIVAILIAYYFILKGWGLFAIIFLPLWKERFDKKHKDTTPEKLYFRAE